MASCIDHTNDTANPTSAFHPPETITIWGLKFASVTLEETLDAINAMIADQTPRYLITANLNYAMLSSQDRRLDPINRDAALIVADGQPIVWRSRTHTHALPERVAGSEMIYRIAERSASDGWRIYLLGAAPGIAQKCAEGMQSLYPNCQIVGVDSPPFRPLSESETDAQLEKIRQAKPDILLVAFGQPKGELWIHQNREKLQVPVSIQLGASFDFVAGAAKRAPRIFQKLGLEWAYRMCHDPKRLVLRYAKNGFFLVKSIFSDIRSIR